MYLKTIVFTVLVGFCVSTMSLHGQPITTYQFKALTFQEGLSHANVNDITQDSLGYIWLGTDNGLNRYDGTEITIFKHIIDDPTSLPDNHVSKIFFDCQDRMWLLTLTSICRYRPASNDFRSYSLGATATHDGHLPFDIAESASGQILVLSHHNTLFALSEKSNRFERYVDLPFEEVAHSVTVYGDHLFVGGQGSVLEVDLGSGHILNTYSLDEEPVSVSSNVGQLEVVGKRLWISGPGIHLHSLDLESRSLKKINALPPTASFAPLTERTLFVGSTQGAFLYHILTGQAQSIKSIDHPHLLKSTSRVFVDRDRNLWTARLQKGVAHTVGKRAFHDARDLNEALVPYADEVSALRVIDPHLWIGLNTGQVVTMDLTSHQLSPPVRAGEGTVFDMVEDGQGEVWAGSYRGGLSRYDSTIKRFVPQHASLDSPQIRSNDIRSIVTDQPGQLWLAVHGKGIDVYDPEQQRVVASHGLSAGDTDPYIADWTFQTVISPEGTVWIASSSGLQMIDGKRKKFFQHHTAQAGSLSDDHVKCLLLDRQGYLWVGTSQGLNVLNPEDSTFTTFTTQQGLNDNSISSLIEDASGRLWMGTYDGLACLSYDTDPKNAQLQNIALPPGQYSHQFVERASTIDARGNLYFATTHGLLVFHPNALPLKKREVPVLITNFEILDAFSDTTASTTLTTLLDGAGGGLLAANENNLAFRFAAVDFVHSNPVQYQYRLLGHNHRWQSTAEQRVAYYSLPPGTYEFQVRAFMPHIFAPIRRGSFSIRHPWYQTAVGQLVLTLLLLIVVILGIYELLERSRLRTLAQLNQKEREVDQLKLKFFTNVSHELRTPLTLMLAPLEQLSQSLSDQRNHRYLGLLKRNTQRLTHLVNQLLDLRQLEQQHYRLCPSEGDIVGFVQDVYRSFQPWADQQTIDYQFEDRTHSSTRRWFDSDVMDKVLSNLLSNAFKYTAQGGSIRVTVSECAVREGWLAVEVSDTGTGIGPEQINRVFDRFYRADTVQHLAGTGIGLSLCQELIRLHQGEISVRSTPNVGSTFRVAIPTHADPYLATIEVEPCDRARPDPVGYRSLSNERANEVPSADSTDDRPLVLVVEDHPDLLLFVKESLLSAFRVATAVNGQEAFQQALTVVPDAIVSDVMMPVMDGLALTQLLKKDQRTSHIPVILLTALASDRDQVKGLELAADDYVTKPFSVAILTAKLQSLIANRTRLKVLFAEGAPSEIQKQIRQSPEKAFLLKLTNIVDQHLDSAEFSTDDVCQAIGMSRSQLYRKLSAVTGKSVHEFIKLHRLAKAAQLLSHGDRGVAEVAYATGFKHATSFTRAFKEHYGCPPSQYTETVK